VASSTQEIPRVGDVPRHVAIIMDGNGRWAKRRFLPRVAGHRKGVEAVRNVVKACAERGVEALTLFAFSSENWRRPAEEVSMLMQLFVSALQQEVERLHQNICNASPTVDPEAIAMEISAAAWRLTGGAK